MTNCSNPTDSEVVLLLRNKILNMFTQGQLVVPKLRTGNTDKILMVLQNEDTDIKKFKAVVISGYKKNNLEDKVEMPGYVSNEWYTDFFDAVTWDEVKDWL